jgi:hypothetical protein
MLLLLLLLFTCMAVCALTTERVPVCSLVDRIPDKQCCQTRDHRGALATVQLLSGQPKEELSTPEP